MAKGKNNKGNKGETGTCGSCVIFLIFIGTVVFALAILGDIIRFVKKLDETVGIRNILLFAGFICVLILLVLSWMSIKKQRMRDISRNDAEDNLWDIETDSAVIDDYLRGTLQNTQNPAQNDNEDSLQEAILNIDGGSISERIDDYNLQRQVIDTPEFGKLYLEAATLLTSGKIKDIESLQNRLKIEKEQVEELVDKLQRGHIVINVYNGEIESISHRSFLDYLKNQYVLYDNKKIYFAKEEKHYGTVIEGNKRSPSYQYFVSKERPKVPANIDSYFYRQHKNLLITSSNADTDISLICNAFCIVNEEPTYLFVINSGINKVCLINTDNNSNVSGLDIIANSAACDAFFEFLLQEIEWRKKQFDIYKVSDFTNYNKQVHDIYQKTRRDLKIDRILVIILDAEKYLRNFTYESVIGKIIIRGYTSGIQVIMSSRLTSNQIVSNNTFIPIRTVEASQVQDMLSDIDLCVYRSVDGNHADDRIYPLSVVMQFVNDAQKRQEMEYSIPTYEYIPVSVVMSSQVTNNVAGNMLMNQSHNSYLGYENIRKNKELSATEKTLSEVDQMTGIEFEHFCKKILSKNGFKEIFVTKASGDYGADLTAKKDGIKYVIQCKRYSGNVGEDSVREVYASKKVYDAEIAVVLTNSYFTDAAYELAKHNHVHLWHRKRLMLLMKEADESQKGVL